MTSKVLLGRGSILSDAVGVDGLTYLPSLPLLSITDPGMTLVHSSTGHLRSGHYKVGIRAHADCRTRPLSLSPRKLLSSHF
ncbi:hypothetical protein T12_7938 [Trichinella patagoniensis]|uniref:Uncharacterized protein n=1 Tax=Trichinella patagoniensis TaxID=990121 RepID=A0A0V0YUF6_9BILA|nr:hypothetical protein T12_7938 [Trichinella patagoniensis]